MRIPFPERLPLDRVALFAVALFAIQQYEGTALYFSAGCTAFILIAAIAFNLGGGLARTAGAYVFFYATLDVIVGLCYKAYLGEPAESNLLEPRRTIAVYVVGIAVLLVAVYISRRFSRKTDLLQNVLKESRMYRASIGCIVFGFVGPFLISLLGESGARLQTAFAQLNQLMPLGILIGVCYEIRRSHGTRSISLPVLIAILYFFFYYGILAFSKQGMLTPLVCWFLPVCALQYRLSMAKVAGCILGVFIVFHYLVPYSQYGRNYIVPNQTLTQRIALSAKFLEHPNNTHNKFVENSGETSYYNTNQGFWERLQFISVDDGLINDTDQGRVYGLSPIKLAFLNGIPRVFRPNKTGLNFGYTYITHYGGKIPEGDTFSSGPGISFSSTAEAYHLAKWPGVLVLAPLIWCLFFFVFDRLFGDLRATPWGLLVILGLSHTAPEGMLTGLIYFLIYDAEIFVFCALFAAWVAPIFAIAVLGPDRRLVAQPTTSASTAAPEQDRPRLWSAGPPAARSTKQHCP